MRYLILSDIHANLDALEAVLAASPKGVWDHVVVLGDLVGYGAEPNAVIDRVRALDPIAVIRGNHDKAACALDDADSFNQVARTAAAWTSEALTEENRRYLLELPAGPVQVDDRVEICHGSPFDEDHYIFDADDAMQALEAASRPVCVFGHTHLPVIFRLDRDGFDGFVPADARTRVPLVADARYLVNPGSVGQPRDGDPRAAYAVYESDGPALALYRVEYRVEDAQRRIRSAGLPQSLANRLAIGR